MLLLKINIVVVEWTLRMIHKARLRTAPVCDKVNICMVTAAWCVTVQTSLHTAPPGREIRIKCDLYSHV